MSKTKKNGKKAVTQKRDRNGRFASAVAKGEKARAPKFNSGKKLNADATNRTPLVGMDFGDGAHTAWWVIGCRDAEPKIPCDPKGECLNGQAQGELVRVETPRDDASREIDRLKLANTVIAEEARVLFRRLERHQKDLSSERSLRLVLKCLIEKKDHDLRVVRRQSKWRLRWAILMTFLVGALAYVGTMSEWFAR